MKYKVISCFAGCGKTTVGKKYPNVLDLQASSYHFDYSNIDKTQYENMKGNQSRIPNPLWPNNYLTAIKKAINEYDLILVPSSLDIRELLMKNNIPFLFVLPSNSEKVKEKLIKRYQARKNDENFIIRNMNYFNLWSRDAKDYPYPIEILRDDEYLEDLLLRLKLLK